MLVEKADFIANNDRTLEDLKTKAQEVLHYFENEERTNLF